MLERTGRRDGVTVTEWELPYTAVDQYWSFNTGGGEGGKRMRKVTLVSAGQQFTVTLDRESGADLLRFLEQVAPHAERARGLRRYHGRRAWIGLAVGVAFLAYFAVQFFGHASGLAVAAGVAVFVYIGWQYIGDRG